MGKKTTHPYLKTIITLGLFIIMVNVAFYLYGTNNNGGLDGLTGHVILEGEKAQIQKCVESCNTTCQDDTSCMEICQQECLERI